MSPSFGEDTNIRILDESNLKENSKEPFTKLRVYRLCVGGYEFVLLCRKLLKKDVCSGENSGSFQLTQTITEEGGGKKC